MTLSTPLANCYPPSILSIVALPVNQSGNLAQRGWDAAVRATVGLQLVFSEVRVRVWVRVRVRVKGWGKG